MNRTRFCRLALMCCASMMAAGTLAAGAGAAVKKSAAPVPEKIEFERDVRPIFAENCLSCHGPDKAKAGVKLTDRGSALAKSKKGRVTIVPGNAGASELIARVSSSNPEKRMPPAEGSHEPLKPRDIEVLRRWIEQGAQWQSHWAFRALARGEAPAVKNGRWVRNAIDAYVLARLEAEGIAPSQEADRYTLIKRLSYDLVGLPPTPEEVDAFVADKSEGAYEKVVTRLLASPHFGERWGRHWLDKARYADSDGYEKDRARPDAYIYRDWVIAALNADMPFDRFTIEQLAGDLLPEARASQKIATAFNRQTLTNEEGGVDQEEYRIAAVFDRVDTVGTVWLGLTVGCAKCHTHKYDQISHTEYYRLLAFFNDADEVTEKLAVKATDLAAFEAKLHPLEQALLARQKQIAPLQKRWEEEQRQRIESMPQVEPKAHRVQVAGSTSSAGASMRVDGEALVVEGKSAATDTYTLMLRTDQKQVTGVRLDAMADAALPGKGPGRSRGGNFVVNAVRLWVVEATGKRRPVRLQHADASFTQAGFNAESVLTGGDAKKGWAISGKMGTNQWLTVYAAKALTLEAGESLRLEIEQNFGGAHTLGRFGVGVLTGDAPLPKTIVQALSMYPEKRVAATKKALFDYYAAQDEQVRTLEDQIAALRRAYKTELTDVRTLGVPVRGRKTHRFERGDFLSPAEEVAPGTFAALPPLEASGKRATRLDLARWLVSEDNPLTPRVTVNHVWAKLMGSGLVRTVDDFGVRGERPSHPELLDHLAASFRGEMHWSLKSLIRTIVTSATYRQSSRHRTELADIDPLNTLLYRQNRVRVEGEIVRDVALAAGGLLSRKIGGPSVFPPMPEDLAKLSYANNFTWRTSGGEDKHRRGIYTFFKRTIPHPTLMTFDCPDANIACVNRMLSNTPLQALTLLNNESFHEAAVALAVRVLGEGSVNDDGRRLGMAMRLTVSRPASDAELSRLKRLLETSRDYYRRHAAAAAELVGKAAGPAGAQETAAWVATLRIILNLDEFITRE